MKYIRYTAYFLLVIVVLCVYGLVYPILFICEKVLFTKLVARGINNCSKLLDKIFLLIPSAVVREVILQMEEESDDELLEREFAEAKQWCKDYRVKGTAFIKEMLRAWHNLLRSLKKHRVLVALNQNSTIPFYREIFKFLRDYAEDYRIAPGILPLDINEILHIKVQIVGMKEQYLSLAELNEHFTLRLVNALSDNKELFNIPINFWDDAVFFPNLKRTLEDGYIIAYIALSVAGKEELIRLRNSERGATDTRLEE